jgi:hypothetical protein
MKLIPTIFFWVVKPSIHIKYCPVLTLTFYNTHLYLQSVHSTREFPKHVFPVSGTRSRYLWALGSQNVFQLSGMCQSILWWLALFKLGADYIAPMMQDLRVERHITWRLILIDSLIWLGDLSPPRWGWDTSDLIHWRAAGLTAASFCETVLICTLIL